MVLRADKGVAMVFVDREDFTDTNTYITKDPANRLKNKHSQTLRDIKNQGRLNDYICRKVYLTIMVTPKFHGLFKIHNIGTPSGPLSPVGSPSHMELPRNWIIPFTPWLASPHTISKTLTSLYNTLRR